MGRVIPSPQEHNDKYMEEFLKAISNYGFPIVVAGYLLLRMERRIADLASAIAENTNMTRSLKETIERKIEKL